MATVVKTRKTAKQTESIARTVKTADKPKMVNIVLSYNSEDKSAEKALEKIMSSGLFSIYAHQPALEESINDIRLGRIIWIKKPPKK